MFQKLLDGLKAVLEYLVAAEADRLEYENNLIRTGTPAEIAAYNLANPGRFTGQSLTQLF